MSLKRQLNFDIIEPMHNFPSTRYQGSKSKLVDWIWENVKNLKFDTVLDSFGGTGSVSYLFKMKNKSVCYNDFLKFNYLIGLALIENDKHKLSDDDANFILKARSNIKYPSFIQETFKNIYYTDEENKWLDTITTNIELIENVYKKAIAYFALFQSCIIKRPYNLFHRKNLYIRTSEVERSFGNKTTWDKPFKDYFIKFVNEANESIFSNGKINKAINCDVFNIEGDYDLVYIDPPYISNDGTSVDYLEFYHFLEGLTDYKTWNEKIDHKSKHRKLKHSKSIWSDKKKIYEAFNHLFDKFKNSILVVSYRSDGIPSINELVKILRQYKHEVLKVERKDYKYVLSNNSSEEILLIAQ